MKRTLTLISLIVTIVVLLTASRVSEIKNPKDYFLGQWYYLDNECTDNISEYGEILITDSTFTIAYVTAGLGPVWGKYEIVNDSIYISGEFSYLFEKIDKNSFKLKYSYSNSKNLCEMIVRRMERQEFELKEEFADYEELDIYFYHAFKRSKKYIDQEK